MNPRPLLGLGLCLFALPAATHPSDYRFVSILSSPTPINSPFFGGASLNNHGAISLTQDPPGPEGQILYRVHDRQWTPLFQAQSGTQCAFSSAERLPNQAPCLSGTGNQHNIRRTGSMTRLEDFWIVRSSCPLKGIVTLNKDIRV